MHDTGIDTNIGIGHTYIIQLFLRVVVAYFTPFRLLLSVSFCGIDIGFVPDPRFHDGFTRCRARLGQEVHEIATAGRSLVLLGYLQE